MNLTGDPWVPVVFATGEPQLVSLKDAFRRGEEIFDLVATPPQRIALTRLLVCIAQVALDGPNDEADWRSCRDHIAPAAVAYLEKWRERFDLFGERGFLQLPNLTPTDNATLDKLGFGLAAGNNAILFDHGASPEGRPHSEAWSAVALVTYQCFSARGRIGTSTWGAEATSGSSRDAPCLEGSMLHAIVRGDSLLATVHLNLVTKEMAERTANPAWGRPVWEQMPVGRGDPTAKTVRTYLGRLVPVSRGIKLNRGDTKVTLVDGCEYPKLPEYREPAATVLRVGAQKDQPRYRRVDPSRHPWRDLASVLTLSKSFSEGGPWVLTHLQGDGQVDLWTGGLAAREAKLLDVAEWVFHLPLSLIRSIELNKYHQGVDLAERGGRSLRDAVVCYFEDLAIGEFTSKDGARFSRNDPRSREQRSKVISKAAAFYWRALDSSYGVLVDAANDPTRSLASEWYGIVRAAMEGAYERACARQGARQLRAYAKGALRLRLRKPGRRDAMLAA